MLLANFTLANYVCAARDPVAHYYARDYARRALAREPACLRKILVKCRQNVANKLFITRVFNPVRPHTWLTVLSALLKELASTSQRERACLDLFWTYESTQAQRCQPSVGTYGVKNTSYE